MKQLSKLKNPDIILINGENYLVLTQKNLFFDTLKNETLCCIELVKESDPKISPMFRLVYTKEKPEDVKLYIYDENSDRFLEAELKSLE